MTIEWFDEDPKAAWVVDARILTQRMSSQLSNYTYHDVRKILVQLASREHITLDMTDDAIRSLLEACSYGGALSLESFAREYSEDHGKGFTWLDCEVKGFEYVKISTGYWIYRADVPDERESD